MLGLTNATSAELYAGLLLDQVEEADVFDVWVGSEKDMHLLAYAFEERFHCAVIKGDNGYITVCMPFANGPAN